MITKRCKYCNKEFEGRISKLYCNDKCKTNHYLMDPTKKKFLRKCVICGTQFQPRTPKTNYCSQKCYNTIRRRKKNPLIKKICPICGNKFEATQGGKKYCSRDCGLKAGSQQQSAKYPLRKVDCLYCGIPFETRRRNQVYCSRKCLNKQNVIINSKNHNSYFTTIIRTISTKTVNNLIKQEVKCQKCGYDKFLPALDYHHITNKTSGISFLINKGLMDGFLDEIQKCILVCANCHRKLHHNSNFKESLI